MTDELKLHADVRAGGEIRLLLNSTRLQDAFKVLEDQYTEAWKRSDARDTDGRERVFSHIQNLRSVKEHLFKVIQDGKLAEAELNRLAKNADRKRFGII